jgi:hypothetical protein
MMQTILRDCPRCRSLFTARPQVGSLGQLLRVLFLGLLLAAPFSLLACGKALAQQTSSVADLSKRIQTLKTQQATILAEASRIREQQRIGPPPTPVSLETIQSSPEEVQIGWMHVNSQQHALSEEARIKFEWLQAELNGLEHTHAQIERTKDPAVAAVLLKEAQHKAELAERLTELFLGSPAPEATTTPGQPAVVASTGTSSGLLRQMEQIPEWSAKAVQESQPAAILEAAKQEFGAGRSGAGGIALYKAAELLSPLQMQKAKGLAVEGDQAYLVFDDRRVALPKLDPEYLALALRCVYGGEGTVQGALTAEEPNAVIVQTGAEQFGEVVWKKEFLPEPWTSVPPGEKVALGFGPGVGMAPQAEPSLNRVTYYGPVAGTRMGETLALTDAFLVTLLDGINPVTGETTGLLRDLHLMSLSERLIRKSLAAKPEDKPPAATESEASAPKPWWYDDIWLVWIPDKFTLRLNEEGSALEYVDAKMRLDIWSVNSAALPPEAGALAQEATERYAELAAKYPPIGDNGGLLDVARAVCLVRWLKREGVPIDLAWANGLALQKKDTPASMPRFLVQPVYGPQGKPVINPPEEAVP